jgi:putative ABC transport system permease protein
MTYMLDTTFNEIAQWDVTALFDAPQTEDLLDEVAGWEGVSAVEPAIVLPATIQGNGEKHDVMLTAFRPDQQMQILRLAENTSLDSALSDGSIVLTAALIDILDLQIGEEVSVKTQFGEKELIVTDTSDELAGEVAYASLDDLLSGSPAPIFNFLYVKADADELEEIKRALFHLPGAASVQLRSEAKGDWEQLIGLFYLFVGVMIALALLMSFALLFNAMTVTVLERQRELATMRAIGARRSHLAEQLFLETTVTWLLALIPGIILGYLVAVQVGKSFSSELFQFTIIIAPITFVVTAIGILVTMLVASYPAFRRVSHLNLAEATKMLT